MAHAEVYILNYNGAHYLGPCLAALSRLQLGEHTLGVNVVDNGSSDHSRQIVAECAGLAAWHNNGKNLGFSCGNNAGVRRLLRKSQAGNSPKPDFHVFLNNDTAVEENWLQAALEVFSDNPNAGIVGSKSLFWDHFVPLKLETPDGYSPADFGSGDTRSLGVFLQAGLLGENIHTSFSRCKLINSYPLEGRGYWLAPNGGLFVAVKDPSKPCKIKLVLENHHPELTSVRLNVSLPKDQQARKCLILERGVPGSIELAFNTEDYVRAVQNAGSYITRNWEGGDRGFLEIDHGQYETTEEVDAICGVSLFIRAHLWQKLGGFDPHFFAYYEDMDLSLRARLLGWRCIYTAQSVLNHVHCGSSGEYSEYFNSNVAWSHLLFTSKMMNSKDWQEKLSSLRARAREEFSQFKLDCSLTGKHSLRAYCRYLKRYPKFLQNRCYALRMQPEKHLFPPKGSA